MPGFFHDPNTKKSGAKSGQKALNTSDLLQELNQMRLELQHHEKLPQKSTVLFEEKPVPWEKNVDSANPTLSASTIKPENGYTAMHQFRIDPPHPELGAEVGIETELTPSATPAQRGSLSFDSILMRSGEATVRKDISHKSPSLHVSPQGIPLNEAVEQEPPKQAEPIPHSVEGSNIKQHVYQHSLPPHREIIHAKPPVEGTLSINTDPVVEKQKSIEALKTESEVQNVIPIQRDRARATVPTSKNHTFRIDTRHGVPSESRTTPLNVVIGRPSSSPRLSPKMGWMLFGEMFSLTLILCGIGGIVCALLLNLRVWMLQLESWPHYGPHSLFLGTICLVCGITLRWLFSTGNARVLLHKTKRERKVLSKYPGDEESDLNETYHRLIELRNQVNDMIEHVEGRVPVQKK